MTIAVLVEALQFYADPANYDADDPGHWTRIEVEPGRWVAEFVPDRGQRARDALRKVEVSRE